MEFLAELHPKIIHFPIVFFILYFVLEFTGAVLKNEHLNKTAYYFLVTGVLFALIGVLTGNQAFFAAQKILKSSNEKVIKLIEQHEQFATITLWYFFTLLIVRTYLLIKKIFSFRWKIVFIALGLAGCYFVIESGLLGGDLVFKYGVGTNLINR